MEHRLKYILVGASGSGKSTMASILEEKLGLSRCISSTTRPPRPGEVDGKDYHFLSEMDPSRMFECARFNGYWYGTDWDALENSDFIILEPQGVSYYREHFPAPLTVIQLERSNINVEPDRMARDTAAGFETVNPDYVVRGDTVRKMSRKLIHLIQSLESEVSSQRNTSENINLNPNQTGNVTKNKGVCCMLNMEQLLQACKEKADSISKIRGFGPDSVTCEGNCIVFTSTMTTQRAIPYKMDQDRALCELFMLRQAKELASHWDLPENTSIKIIPRDNSSCEFSQLVSIPVTPENSGYILDKVVPVLADAFCSITPNSYFMRYIRHEAADIRGTLNEIIRMKGDVHLLHRKQAVALKAVVDEMVPDVFRERSRVIEEECGGVWSRMSDGREYDVYDDIITAKAKELEEMVVLYTHSQNGDEPCEVPMSKTDLLYLIETSAWKGTSVSHFLDTYTWNDTLALLQGSPAAEKAPISEIIQRAQEKFAQQSRHDESLVPCTQER